MPAQSDAMHASVTRQSKASDTLDPTLQTVEAEDVCRKQCGANDSKPYQPPPGYTYMHINAIGGTWQGPVVPARQGTRLVLLARNSHAFYQGLRTRQESETRSAITQLNTMTL